MNDDVIYASALLQIIDNLPYYKWKYCNKIKYIFFQTLFQGSQISHSKVQRIIVEIFIFCKRWKGTFRELITFPNREIKIEIESELDLALDFSDNSCAINDNGITVSHVSFSFTISTWVWMSADYPSDVMPIVCSLDATLCLYLKDRYD